jgi:mevalonate kinase
MPAVFYGKLLLFGEYSVIYGSEALVLPYKKVSAHLDFRKRKIIRERNAILQSAQSIRQLADYLDDMIRDEKMDFPFDVRRLEHDIEQGLYLCSSIPMKYGLGSSAALCASLYDGYAVNPVRLTAESVSELFERAKGHLSQIESFFHGKSSGIDPLCSYSGLALHIIKENNICPLPNKKLKNLNTRMFLIDSRKGGETGPLVSSFMDRMREEEFASVFMKDYIPLVNNIIKGLVSDEILLMDDLTELSRFQLQHFGEMIPGSLKCLWEKGVETGTYTCKLCGSGGGGYILGFTSDFERTQAEIMKGFNHEIQWFIPRDF